MDQNQVKPNACCNIQGNLVQSKDGLRPDLQMQICVVCNCRHFEMSVDPAKIFALVKNVG